MVLMMSASVFRAYQGILSCPHLIKLRSSRLYRQLLDSIRREGQSSTCALPWWRNASMNGCPLGSHLHLFARNVASKQVIDHTYIVEKWFFSRWHLHESLWRGSGAFFARPIRLKNKSFTPRRLIINNIGRIARADICHTVCLCLNVSYQRRKKNAFVFVRKTSSTTFLGSQ